MLLNLPTEIILTISSHLPLQDKVDFAVTCHRLHDLIAKTNLYQVLDLLRHDEATTTIVNKFETHQLDGTQVKTLSINSEYLSKQQLNHISRIFPNVTRLEHDRHYWIDDSKLVTKWKDTLEQCGLEDKACLSLAKMENLTFPRLTELELGINRDNYEKNKGFNPTRFLSITKSTPSLKVLCLRQCDINLEFFEGLHANCPNLQSLVLKEAMIVIDNGYSPKSITPASSVLKLQIDDDSVILDTSVAYLDYIVKKYVNLQILYLSFGMEEETAVFKHMIACCYSEVYVSDIMFGHYTDAQIEEINTKVLSLVADRRSTLQVYRTSGHDFLSKLPKSLKTFQLGAGIFNNVMQPLSLSGSNLVRLDIIKNNQYSKSVFQQPNDVAYLQKLPHLKLLTTSLYTQVQQYDQITASISITKLYIDMTEGTLYLGWILKKFPSLEELDITAKGCVVKRNVEGGESKEEAHLKLRYLNIKSDDIQQESITFVKTVAPNLKDLHLTLYKLKMSNTKSIDLTNWELDKCSISFDNRIAKINYVICNITNNNITKQLAFHYGPISYMLLPEDYIATHIKYIPKRAPRINLSCDTIQHLKIENYKIKPFGNDIVGI